MPDWYWQRSPRGGRPREHWYVTDHKARRLDANALRRQAIDEGRDLSTLDAIDVRTWDEDRPPTTTRIGLAIVPDPRYRWRVWLICPRCQRRRVHLYPIRSGIKCRECAGIRFGSG